MAAQNSVGGCGCKLVIKKLAALGATHAAEMHAKGNSQVWTAQDWLLHFSEEERYILPRLKGKVPDQVIRAILADHGVMRRDIARNAVPGRAWPTTKEMQNILSNHARIEDEILTRVNF